MEISKATGKNSLGKKIGLYTFLFLFGTSMIMPFLWTLSTSLKEAGEIFSQPPKWMPKAKFIDKDGEKVEVKIKRELLTLQVIETGEIISNFMDQNAVLSERQWPNIFQRKYYFWEKLDEKSKWQEVTPKKVYVNLLEKELEVEIVNERKIISVSAKTISEKLQPVWKNFKNAWQAIPFGRGYINSIVIASIVVLGQVFTSALAAYAFARLHFPGRDKIFLGYLATMMIPAAVTMIPVFILLKKIPEVLNWFFHTDFWSTPQYLGTYLIGNPIGLDSYFALIVPALFSAYGTFMLRQFFITIPGDLEDAARIDGCSLFGIFRQIILPLSKPALATLTIFTFMGSWNNFMWPLIVTNITEMKTIPIMIASFQGVYATDWHLLMAASLIALFPILVVFIFGQRFFVEGIRLGAIKG